MAAGGWKEDDAGFGTRPLIVIVALSFVLISVIACVTLTGYKTPRYSASIDAVSGLDLDHDLSRNSTDTLSPLFNVTVRVTSRGFMESNCVPASSVVEVSYAGATLAAGRVLQPFCARPRKTSEQRVVAWGDAVRVPGFALDGLAADARRREQAFDVAVWMHWTLVSCRGLRARDAGALGSPCAASDAHTVLSGPRPGVHNGRAS